jgi:hypothetical protein
VHDRQRIVVGVDDPGDGLRPWDTTLYATTGDQLFTPEERATAEELWNTAAPARRGSRRW